MASLERDLRAGRNAAADRQPGSNKELREIVADPVVYAAPADRSASTPSPARREELGEFVKGELVKWGRWTKDAGIQPESGPLTIQSEATACRVQPAISWHAFHTFSGVAGIWILCPAPGMASANAFITAAIAAVVPASPAPLTPSGLVVAGTS